MAQLRPFLGKRKLINAITLIRRLLHSAHPVLVFLWGRRRAVAGAAEPCIDGDVLAGGVIVPRDKGKGTRVNKRR